MSELVKISVSGGSVQIIYRYSVKYQLGSVYEYGDHMLVGGSKAGQSN